MNRILTFVSIFMSAFLILALSVSDAKAQDATANLQIIHNSPDPAVSSVDIFVNGDEFLTGVDFRAATPFTEVPAGVDLDVQIAPTGSGIGAAVGPFTFNLDENENYVLVASGVVDEMTYPDAAAFSLEAFTPALTASDSPNAVAVNIHHGSPDAPAVDIYTNQTGETAAVPSLAYPEFTGYVELAPDNEVVGIAGAGGDVLVEFSAPFADLGLEGAALTVLASGFFDADSADETNGFGLLAVLADGTTVLLDVYEEPSTANLQIIHNSPDPAVSSVDIFVNGDEFLADVDFRAATAFTEVPAGVELSVQIAPANAGIENAVGPFTYTLEEDENYVLVASGVVDEMTYPDAAAFSLEAFTPALTASNIPEAVAVNIHHGSPDAPAVDIYTIQTGETAAVEGLAYPEFTGYVELAADNEIVGIAGAGGDVLVEFSAPLADLGLEGAAVTVLASGFFDAGSADETNGFGLLAVLADGTTVLLDVYEEPPTANLQIIHNSPDPAVSSVDIFVNGDEFLTGVDFRAATPFTEVPAGVELSVQIAPADAGIESAVGPFTYTLEEDENYVLVASGVVDEMTYPDAAAFSLEAFTPAQTEATDPLTVDVNIHHGSPDAPAVDIFTIQTGETAAVEGLAYPEFTGYVALSPNNETIGIAGAGGEILAEFLAPLSDLNTTGAAITVLASGFFDGDSAGESNGFGLIAVLADGTVLTLDAVEPAPTTANVQIIHNSPDPAAQSVDVYVNGDLTLPGVEFRTATSFLELPGDTPLDIVVSPADADIEDGISFEGVEFTAGSNYYVVASGVLDPTMFAANPNDVVTNFFLDVIPGANLSADEDAFDFLLYHGAPDAPAVDIDARDVAPLADAVTYTDYSADYISVPANEYVIDVSAAGAADPLVSFDADVSTLGGQTGIILASGFLNPAANNDGPGFGVIVVLTDGTVVELGLATSNENIADGLPERFELDQNYPNPFNPTTTISYSLPQSSDVTVEVFNITGQRVATLVNTQQSAGEYSVSFDASSLSSGMYMYRIQAENFTQTRKMTLIK